MAGPVRVAIWWLLGGAGLAAATTGGLYVSESGPFRPAGVAPVEVAALPEDEPAPQPAARKPEPEPKAAETPAPEPEPEAAEAPEPEPEPETAEAPEPESAEEPQADLPPPSVDVVRIEPDGSGLIAGKAAPGAVVSILLDDAVIETVTSDATGSFLSFLNLAPSTQPRVLTVLADLEGQSVAAEDQIILAPVAEAPVIATAEPEAVAEPVPDAAPREDPVAESDQAPEAAPEPEEAPAQVAEAKPEPVEATAPVADTEPAEEPQVVEAKPEVVEEPQVADAEPVEESQVAEAKPEPVEEPQVAEAKPEVVEAPQVAEAKPEPVEEPQVAEAKPEPVEEPQVAETKPEPVEEPQVAETKAEPVEEPQVADAKPEPVEEAQVADAEPEPVEEPQVAEAKPEPVEEPQVAEVKPEPVEEPAPEPVAEAPKAAPVPPAAVVASSAPEIGAGDADRQDSATPLTGAQDRRLALAQPSAPATPPGNGNESGPAVSTSPAPMPGAAAEPGLAPAAQATTSATPPAGTQATDAPDPKPLPFVVLRAGRDGVEVLQSANPERPLAMDRIELDTISYSDTGDVQLAGRAQGQSTVRVYLDNERLTDLDADDHGRWTGQLDGVEPGVYTLRLDEVGPDGSVISRIETPFKREPPETLRPPAPGTAAERAAIRAVTVQKGDSLWAISRERYGEGLLYVRVFEANRDAIRDPDLIYPGQVFSLPE